MRKWIAGAVLAVTSVMLTGCEGAVRTEVKILSATEATVTTSVVFTGDAARAVYYDQAILDDLVANMERLTQERPTVTLSPDEIVATSPLTFEQLLTSSKVTGVSGFSYEASEDTATVRVILSQPENLVESITAAASERPDSESLSKAMLANTYIEFAVSYPGAARILEAKNATAEVSGSVVEVKRGVTNKTRATVHSEGSLNRVANFPVWAVAAAVGGVLVLASAIGLRRKKLL